jgi:hypothetical protein
MRSIAMSCRSDQRLGLDGSVAQTSARRRPQINHLQRKNRQ